MSEAPKLSRRTLLAGSGFALLGARGAFAADARYARVNGDHFPIPAVNLSRIGHSFLRTTTPYSTEEAPGTIVVDPDRHFLYLVEADGQAVRYGVGVGREGFAWSGDAVVKTKQEWPDWYPPKDMLQRQPELMRSMSRLQSGLGMHGGPRNPLGARALYLWQNNEDTLYRIHGTVEPWSIGHNASSGCIRMINQDVIDLYARVPVGTKVVVLPSETESTSPSADDESSYGDGIPRDLVKDRARLIDRGLF